MMEKAGNQAAQEKIGKIQFWEKTFWKTTDKHKMQEKMNKIQFWKKHPGKTCKHKVQEKFSKMQFWKKHSGKTLISTRCRKK